MAAHETLLNSGNNMYIQSTDHSNTKMCLANEVVSSSSNTYYNPINNRYDAGDITTSSNNNKESSNNDDEIDISDNNEKNHAKYAYRHSFNQFTHSAATKSHPDNSYFEKNQPNLWPIKNNTDFLSLDNYSMHTLSNLESTSSTEKLESKYNNNVMHEKNLINLNPFSNELCTQFESQKPNNSNWIEQEKSYLNNPSFKSNLKIDDTPTDHYLKNNKNENLESDVKIKLYNPNKNDFNNEITSNDKVNNDDVENDEETFEDEDDLIENDDEDEDEGDEDEEEDGYGVDENNNRAIRSHDKNKFNKHFNNNSEINNEFDNSMLKYANEQERLYQMQHLMGYDEHHLKMFSTLTHMQNRNNLNLNQYKNHLITTNNPINIANRNELSKCPNVDSFNLNSSKFADSINVQSGIRTMKASHLYNFIKYLYFIC